MLEAGCQIMSMSEADAPSHAECGGAAAWWRFPRKRAVQMRTASLGRRNVALAAIEPEMEMAAAAIICPVKRGVHGRERTTGGERIEVSYGTVNTGSSRRCGCGWPALCMLAPSLPSGVIHPK